MYEHTSTVLLITAITQAYMKSCTNEKWRTSKDFESILSKDFFFKVRMKKKKKIENGGNWGLGDEERSWLMIAYIEYMKTI